jgi:hypothetical protein
LGRPKLSLMNSTMGSMVAVKGMLPMKAEEMALTQRIRLLL